MVVTPEPGLLLIENNASTQIWSNPDNIDLANFQFGYTYLFLYLETNSPQIGNQINKEVFPSGFSFAVPLAEWNVAIPFEGWLKTNTLDQSNLVNRFFARHRRASNPLLSIMIKFGTNQYWQFANPQDTMLNFVTGYLSDLIPSFSQRENLFKVKGNFEVVYQ